MPIASTEQLERSFLEEYNSNHAILKYSSQTAGHGVSYLIEHEYAAAYDQAIEICRRTSSQPLRLLEFGCGAGMNVIGLLARLARRSIPIKDAFGTDFAESLIESARREARASLPSALREKLSFHVASNERLSMELATATGTSPEALFGSFDFIFGVNTFRYCHRLSTERDCADDVFRLLRRGGTCVMIDMNDRFPLFRSHLKRTVESSAATYLPSLEEYTEPFRQSGFEILAKRHFSWIPHSAGPSLTRVCRMLTPILNVTVPSRAMRSLVIAKKPL
jgi:2-polyprenyl-3-methyl-5-hydroxy-6-metoxy-1,4-benzoquinol methylase